MAYRRKIQKWKRRLWASALPHYIRAVEAANFEISELVRYTHEGLNEKEIAWVQNKLDQQREWVKIMREFSLRLRRSVDFNR